MSFDLFSVTLESPSVDYYTEFVTVPVIETFWQRTARFFTRKDAPTASVPFYKSRPHFHTVEVDDTYDAETVRDLLDTLTDRYGYEIVSVVVDENHTSTELVVNGTPTGAEVGQLLVAMDEDPYYVAGYVALTHYHGFGMADDLVEWMADHYQGEHDSPAAYAENLYDDAYAHDAKGMPDWVETDWDASAENLSADVDYIEHPGSYSTHVFWKH